MFQSKSGVVEIRVHMLKWICICLAIMILGALAIRYVVGNNPLVQQDAVTYIIYATIVGAFLWSTIRCGTGTGLLEETIVDYKNLKKAEHVEREGWFWSSTCASLGLIGTVWGMILMAKAFIGFNPEDDTASTALVTATGAGMGAALYTTLLGQVCSQILNFQYFSLSQSIEKAKTDDKTTEIQ